MTPEILALGLNAVFTFAISMMAAVSVVTRQLEPDEVNGAYIMGGAAAFLFALSIMAIVE